MQDEYQNNFYNISNNVNDILYKPAFALIPDVLNREKDKNSMDMGAGYLLCTNDEFRKVCGKDFYTIYHNIICIEISKNNILGVNGLIRWIDACGYFPYNKLLFEYSLINGSFEIFLMIYYINLFWSNDDDDKKYLTYDNVHNIINNIKSIINVNSLILNELNYVPKDVIGLITGIQLNINVIDYYLKYDFIKQIYDKYDALYYYVYDDYKLDEFENIFKNKLVKYDINMNKINKFFMKSMMHYTTNYVCNYYMSYFVYHYL